MSAKHTPGPWKIRRVTHYDIRIAPESEPEHVSIAGMAIWGEEHREELEANARLIATAPELLEGGKELNSLVLLAQRILALYLPPDGISMAQAIDELLALFDGPKQRAAQEKWGNAIARAEGGQ